MTDIEVNERLKATSIRMEQDFAVPTNGHKVNIPYIRGAGAVLDGY